MRGRGRLDFPATDRTDTVSASRDSRPVGDQFLPHHRFPDRSRAWATIYALTTLALVATFLVARRFPDARFGDFHLLTTSAAAMALIAGILTLVRYHSRPSNTLLFIGAALIGVGVLDFYHALISSAYFGQAFPTAPGRLAAWSWTISRLFLSVILLASWAAGVREDKLGRDGRIDARSIYDDVILLALVCLGFFIVVPLPSAYHPEWLVPRPYALGIAGIFLLSLIGYVRRGVWRRSPFEKWLVLALILFFLSDALFISFSAAPFDVMSATAHFLKIAAYGAVLFGVVESTYRLFRRVEETGVELEGINRSLALEIETRKEAQAELGQAERSVRDYAARLQSSNAELEQFAYAASHDLQEPLRMIAGYTSLLANKYKGQLDAQADLYIGYTVDGVSRMQKLIDDLLTYSRVETHGKPFERIASAEALSWATTNLEAAIQGSGASVTCDPLPEIVAEPTQLGQLFQNLISNSIKYRGDGPPAIHASAEREDTGWRFSVSDNGIGIVPEDLDRVFELFRRLETGAEASGTGIGLAVCKRIVDRHGGRIWVESTPGEGSTFFFTLPDSDAAPA
jgi:signal transduction histidine kinase